MNSKGKQIDATPELLQENRKRNVSSDQITKQVMHAHNQSTSKISRMSDESIPTSRVSGMNTDSLMNRSDTTIQIELHKSSLTSSNEEFPNIKESNSSNQEIRVLHHSGGNEEVSTILQITPSNINISQKGNAEGKIADSLATEKGNILSDDDILADPGPSRSYENIPKSHGQKAPLKMKICENKNTSGRLSDSGESTGKLKFSTDNILGNAGPSRSSENLFQSNLNQEEFKNKQSSNQEQNVETEEKRSMCPGCNMEIANQDNVHEVDYLYNYCQCNRKSMKWQMIDAKKSLQEIEYVCNRCLRKFPSKSEFEDHYLEHEPYHSKFCRFCKNKVCEHNFNGEGDLFRCCKCSKNFHDFTRLRIHLYIHSDLRLFKCEICKSRFKIKSAMIVHQRKHNANDEE